jgi:hypothetical protein
MSKSNGVCTGTIGGAALTFDADGNITVSGQNAGTWTASGNNLTIVASGSTVSCTKS